MLLAKVRARQEMKYVVPGEVPASGATPVTASVIAGSCTPWKLDTR